MPEFARRVLVVDDDPALRDTLAAVLLSHGLDVHTAGDGLRAVELLRENGYGVVVLDPLVPVADGFTVLDAMQMIRPRNEPVVLVVASAETRIAAQLDASRIQGIIRKPFDADDLAALVAACAEVRARGRFGPMALAALVSGAPLLALLSLRAP